MFEDHWCKLSPWVLKQRRLFWTHYSKGGESSSLTETLAVFYTRNASLWFNQVPEEFTYGIYLQPFQKFQIALSLLKDIVSCNEIVLKAMK